MTWQRRADGELKLSVLMGFELASAGGDAVAVRLDHAETQDQLNQHAPPTSAQLVMKPDAAEALGMELIAAAQRARGTASN